MGAVASSMIFPAPAPSYDRRLSGLYLMGDVPILHIKRGPKTRRGVLLFFHGNGTDLGRTCRFAYRMAEATNMDVIVPEYPGYGVRSQERATVEGCSATAAKVIDMASRMYIDEDMMIVGQSIGTAVCVQGLLRCPTRNAKHVLLISPLTSVCDVAMDTVPVIGGMVYSPETFNTLEAIDEIVPWATMEIVHGVSDRVIPHCHAERLKARRPSATLTLIAGGHNNLCPERLLRAMADGSDGPWSK